MLFHPPFITFGASSHLELLLVTFQRLSCTTNYQGKRYGTVVPTFLMCSPDPIGSIVDNSFNQSAVYLKKMVCGFLHCRDLPILNWNAKVPVLAVRFPDPTNEEWTKHAQMRHCIIPFIVEEGIEQSIQAEWFSQTPGSSSNQALKNLN